jgi:NarL family two-component system sensor histidine kinase LiaS
LWSEVLSQSPANTNLIRLLLNESDATITNRNFLRIGSMQFSVSTLATMQALVIGADGTLLGKSKDYLWPTSVIGQPFDTHKIQGLEAPLNAALAGETDANRLFSVFEPNKRLIIAIPIIRTGGEELNKVVGAIVVILNPLPSQADIPAHILNIASRSLLILFLGAGIMGAVFGAIIANGVAKRFNRISATTDAWSIGDFSMFIEDNTGDEISHFAGRLNKMAKQLQDLLRRRQAMAISEERNRLARDLHDSAKQQALAASFELGTALTLFDRDQLVAKQHLVEADALVDGVRKELTNLVHELRPQSMDGQDFCEMLKEYAMDWSQRNGIALEMNIEEDGELSIETRETLFRIAQEALANTARHSAATSAHLTLQLGTDTVTMIIQDDGHGFATDVQHSGVGLASMRERVEVVGGSIQVESSPEQGTRVVVTVPKDNLSGAPSAYRMPLTMTDQ